MEEFLAELKIQTDILRTMNGNIAGLRADLEKAGKEGVEKAMKDAMAQMTAAFKGTPVEKIMAGMMPKMGGQNG